MSFTRTLCRLGPLCCIAGGASWDHAQQISAAPESGPQCDVCTLYSGIGVPSDVSEFGGVGGRRALRMAYWECRCG